jgi:hypothetical protein
MKLATEDVALFYKLMGGLQFYVNQQRQVLPGVDSVETYTVLPTEDKLQVRNVLWENPALIDAYVAANPHDLPPEELDIIKKW